MSATDSLSDDPAAFLAPTWFVDSDHPDVVAWAERAVGDATTDRDKAIRLFYAVRDGIRYDPYSASRDPAAYQASAIAHVPAAYCVPKAVLLAAVARASGVPARLGFADVRNHLQSEKLRERMGTDLFVYHGYVELYVDGRWVKATPAFNLELCQRFGVQPLEFDGEHDALLHPYDTAGNRHMEYVRDRGVYADLPLDAMFAAWAEVYDDSIIQDAAGQPVHDDAFHG